MSAPVPVQLCPHKQNPQACLSCYHARSRAPAQAARQQAPRDPNRIVAPANIQNVIDRGFADNGGVVQQGAVPAPQGPQAIQPERRERPAQPRQPQGHDPNAAPVAEPFSYAQAQPWQPDAKGLLVPPPRRSLIDAQPRHPSAGK